MATDTQENLKLDVDKASKALTEKGHACLACKSENWLIAPDYVSPVPVRYDKFVQDSAYPSVMVACADCGMVYFYNASVLGLWDYASTVE